MTAGGPPAPPSRRAGEVQRLLLLAAYMALIGYAGIHHAIWRDEAQAWLIARDADGLATLLANLRYDGHPALWHLFLFALSRLGDDPNLMLALNFVVMSSAVAVALWCLPLRTWERVLFPFGYYMLFEYGVKARSYGLGTLLVIVLCALWPERGRRPLAIALVLVLAANTHVLFLILSIAAVAALAIESLAHRPGAMRPGAGTAAALAVVGAGWVVAFATFLPPGDSGFAVGWHLAPSAAQLARVLDASTAILGRSGVPWLVPAALAVLAGTGWALRRRPAAATFLGLSLLGLAGFFYAKLPGQPWHQGVIFLALLAAAWIGRGERPPSPSAAEDGTLAACLGAVLAAQAAFGALAYRDALMRPYSNGKAVAAFIARSGWADDLIAGAPDFALAPVVAYLGTERVYFLNGARWGSFTVWDRRRQKRFRLAPALEKLAADGRPVVLVKALPAYKAPKLARFGFAEVARFTGAAEKRENYVVYRRPAGG